MKTTIDIPESLYRQVKVKAAQEGVTLRELLLAAITRGLNQRPAIGAEATGKHFNVDELGIPLLKRSKKDKTVVSEEFLNRLREEEGI